MNKQLIRRVEQLYAYLLQLYPRSFRQQFAEEMKFVFANSLRMAGEQSGSKGIFILLGWTLIDLCLSLFKEHWEERKGVHPMNSLEVAERRHSAMTIQKSGGLASFLLAVAFIVPEMIYLVGNLREANGLLAYAIADFLYGPVRAACLVMALYALREHMGERAQRPMSLTLLVAALAAGMFVTAALFRSTNRHYHLLHPELNLEMSTTVLAVWATLVGGVIATGWHLLGWSLVLLGAAGWSSGRLPRGLCLLYWLVGTQALFVYLQPELEGGVVLLGLIMSIWQGIVLWRSDARATPPPPIKASRPELA